MDFNSTWVDYALYLPAPNKDYAHFAVERMSQTLRDRLPTGVRAVDFNFLDPNAKLFHWPNMLYTAAFAVNDSRADMVKKRDRDTSFVLGDSGGYSLISGAVKTSHASFRAEVLKWQECCCDVGIILDIPTRSLNVPASGIRDFRECLERTKANLIFAKDNRTASDLRLLSVYQGRDHKEAEAWAKEVSGLRLEGLAIAGHTRLDMWFWAKKFRDMLDAEDFDHVTHIHFLGTAQPAFAVLATALQCALRKHVRSDITVSFDSSLGFAIAQRYGQITTGLLANGDDFRLINHTMPARGGEFEPEIPFPYRSPLADRCTNGDFMPGTDPWFTAVDGTGNMMISNHAVYTELSAILQANRLMDMAQRDGNAVVPFGLRKAVELIDEVFAGSGSEKALTSLRTIMRRKPVETGDIPERIDE